MTDRQLLEQIRDQLYRWAQQSESGGWSTHQVEAQRKMASQIAEHLATSKLSCETAEAKLLAACEALMAGEIDPQTPQAKTDEFAALLAIREAIAEAKDQPHA
jgi:hypothetical protein